MGYTLLMLGPPILRPDCDQTADHVMLKSRKGQALLYYIASQPTVSFAREHLFGLLWDDAPTQTARRAFATMLSRLRTELPANCFRGPRGQLSWNSEAGISTDLTEFLRLTEHVETRRGVSSPLTLTQEQKADVYRALSLWRGPFLDGFSCDSSSFEEWMITERHQWELRMLTALTALLNAEKADGRWEVVQVIAQQALKIDPLQETFHRAMMEALFHQGNRSAALAHFELCRQTLKEQLNTEPDAMTMELFETIRSSAYPSLQKPSHSPGGSNWLRVSLHPDPEAMPPLIGRQREYNQVNEALRHTVHQGGGHIVLVHGEAGIGKTRLLSEVVNAAASQMIESDFPTVLIGRAYESMRGVPYAAFVDALEPVMQAVDLSALNLADVWLRELGRLLPDVFAHRPDLNPPAPMESDDDRLRLFQAVARFLGSLPQPILLALDDLQWADALSASLLAYLMRYPSRPLSLAAVVTVRDGDDSDELRLILNTFEREKRLTRVGLNHLTKNDTIALVETLSPMVDRREQADRIYAHSMGHPLYTVELVNMLAAGHGDNDRALLSKAAPLPVPPTVQDVFIGRLVRLGDVATAVADALSLFRQGATLDQLRRVTHLAPADVVGAIQSLLHGYIVNESSDGTLSFRHDVYQSVILEKLPQTRRIHLHRQIYSALTQEIVADTPNTPSSSAESMDKQLLADLIAHSMGGQMWKEALGWTRQAASEAERLFAFSTAVEHLNMSLVCLDHLPKTEEYRRQRLNIELQVARLDTWSPPAQRDARLAAIEQLAQKYGAATHLPLVHIAQAESLILQGRCNEAAGILEKLAPLASRDPRLALGLNAWQGAIDALSGHVSSALDHFRKVQEAMGEEVLKPGTSVYAGMAACYATAGDFEQADAALVAMKQEEKQQGYESLTSKLLTVTATVAYLRGQWSKAVEYARRGLQTSRTAQDPANEALSALWLGAAMLELDNHDSHEAVWVLEEALTASEQAQTYTRRDFIYAFLALGYAQTRQYDRASSTLWKGLQLVEKLGYLEGRALCSEIQGRMAVIQGMVDSARQHLQDALAQYESLGNVAGARRCRNHLSCLRNSS